MKGGRHGREWRGGGRRDKGERRGRRGKRLIMSNANTESTRRGME